MEEREGMKEMLKWLIRAHRLEETNGVGWKERQQIHATILEFNSFDE